MTAALRAGQLDQIPDHILKLEQQMHEEWLSKRTLEQLSAHPDWVMQEYFLSAGQPDRTKTNAVIGVVLDRYNKYRSGQMIEAASNISGLHHRKVIGKKF